MRVVLDNLRSAQNVGTIIRTCDGLGIRNVELCGITPEITHPGVQKTALGAEKQLTIHSYRDTYERLTELKKKNIQIVGLEITKKSTNLDKVVADDECALVVGNEVSGISDEILSLCDIVTNIPMQGKKESFNVAVAFGIAAYTLRRLAPRDEESKI